MANGRCRMYGGRSTGPSTPEGLVRLTAARTTRGTYSAEARAFRAGCQALLARGKLLTGLARNPCFGRDPAALRPFFQPVFPKPQPRKPARITPRHPCREPTSGSSPTFGSNSAMHGLHALL
jgi:hypothetical protein